MTISFYSKIHTIEVANNLASSVLIFVPKMKRNYKNIDSTRQVSTDTDTAKKVGYHQHVGTRA